MTDNYIAERLTQGDLSNGQAKRVQLRDIAIWWIGTQGLPETHEKPFLQRLKSAISAGMIQVADLMGERVFDSEIDAQPLADNKLTVFATSVNVWLASNNMHLLPVSPGVGGALKTKSQKTDWQDPVNLKILWEMSLRPGMNHEKLGAAFGVSRQAITRPLKNAREMYGSQKKASAFDPLKVRKVTMK